MTIKYLTNMENDGPPLPLDPVALLLSASPLPSAVELDIPLTYRRVDLTSAAGTAVAMTPTQFGSRNGNSMSRRFSHASLSSSTRSFNAAAGTVGDAVEPKESELDLPVPSFRRLLMLNAPEWKQALMGCLNAVIFGGIQPSYAYVLGSMTSVYFLKDHDDIKSKTRTYALIFIFLFILSLVINIGQHYNFGAMGEYLTKRLRERMLSKMLTFEVGWFDQDENSTGAICSRFAKDANVVLSLWNEWCACGINNCFLCIHRL